MEEKNSCLVIISL